MTRSLNCLTLLILLVTADVFAQTTPLRPPAANGPIVEPASPPPGQRPAGPQAAIPPIPMEPDWVAKLSPAEMKWVDDVLQYWETSSEKIKLFECKFQRWDYDGGFVADEKWQPRTYAEGTI